MVLPALALLALALITASIALPRPDDGLSWSPRSRQILYVASGGPGERAGLARGDTILAIESRQLNDSARLYNGLNVGDVVTFTVRRGGEVHRLPLALGPPGALTLLKRLEPLLVALALSVIGIVTLLAHPAASEARLFFLLGQLGGAVLAAGLLSTVGLPVAGALFGFLLCWLAPLIAHFHAIFPAGKPLRFWGWLRWPCYGVAVALSLPYLIAMLPDMDWIADAPALFIAARLYLAGASLTAVAFLIYHYSRVPYAATRQRIRLVVVATVAALLPLAMFSLLPEAVYGQPIISYEVSFALLVLTPLAYGYAIYKHNLWWTDHILNRSLVILILSIGSVSAYFATAVILKRFLPDAEQNSSVIGTVVIIATAIALPFFRQKMQKLVDRFFYGGWYDYGTVVGEFSRALSGVLDEADFCELMACRLPATLRVRNAALLLPGPQGALIVRRRYNQAGEEAPEQIAGGNQTINVAARAAVEMIPAAGPLVRRLQQPVKIWETEALRKRLTHARLSAGETALLADSTVELWMPLVFQGELQGLLLLGQRLADDFYHAEDYRILETLSWQAATAARNAHLVGELRHSLQEGAEAHRRLLVGREEERRRLAREIHDGPVQTLIGFNFQLREAQRHVGADGEGGPALEKLRGESLKLLSELRRICADLRPPVLDILGLGAAMQAYAAEQSGAEHLTTFDIDEGDVNLSDNVAISLFRIYQEALANALRHARARSVCVSLRVSQQGCELIVQDDGQGFEMLDRADTLMRRGHFGLMGMRERAEVLGGTLELISTPGCGTRVTAQVPLNGKGEAQ